MRNIKSATKETHTYENWRDNHAFTHKEFTEFTRNFIYLCSWYDWWFGLCCSI